MSAFKSFLGRCHCGDIRFQVELEVPVKGIICNCSICDKTGFLHAIVPSNRFKLLKGKNQLSNYQFNTAVAQHYFCSKCGIKSFYIPRSNPDGYSVNLRCVDDLDLKQVEFESFDGENWEVSGGKLKHLSQ